MPFGINKDAKVSAEFKKHEQEIMENARKNSIRKNFHHLDVLKSTGNKNNAIVVDGQAYEVIYDDMRGEFMYRKSSDLVLNSEKELQELLALYKEEKLKK